MNNTHILLVDDEAAVRNALERVLTRAGYTVMAVENGAQAIEYAQQRPVDLVVTDLIMPEQEGIETIVRLRRIHPNLPIVAMSGGGSGDPADYLKIARGLGAKATLAKPFHPDVLLTTIARFCPPPSSP